MAVEPITADMVNDAGIAASIAANANVIPEPSIYFQDFSFGATMFDAAFGNVEALGGVGLGVADKAVDEMIRLAAEERKKDDPASDASMIAELGAQQREELSAMREVTYSNGQFHMYGLDIDEEDMEAEMEESSSQLDEHARKYGWDEATKAQMAILYASFEQASGQEQSEIFEQMREVGGEQWAKDRAHEAHERGTARPSNQISASETQDADTAQIDDTEIRQSIAVTVVEATDSVMIAEASRGTSSIGDNPFADTRSPNAEFNSQATGDVQLAQATPAQTAPTVSAPTLLNG